MIEIEDWLQDPLRKIENGTYKTRKLKAPKDNQNDLWFSFHFATRLKLDGADFFCRQAGLRLFIRGVLEGRSPSKEIIFPLSRGRG